MGETLGSPGTNILGFFLMYESSGFETINYLFMLWPKGAAGGNLNSFKHFFLHTVRWLPILPAYVIFSQKIAI